MTCVCIRMLKSKICALILMIFMLFNTIACSESRLIHSQKSPQKTTLIMKAYIPGQKNVTNFQHMDNDFDPEQVLCGSNNMAIFQNSYGVYVLLSQHNAPDKPWLFSHMRKVLIGELICVSIERYKHPNISNIIGYLRVRGADFGVEVDGHQEKIDVSSEGNVFYSPDLFFFDDGVYIKVNNK